MYSTHDIGESVVWLMFVHLFGILSISGNASASILGISRWTTQHGCKHFEESEKGKYQLILDCCSASAHLFFASSMCIPLFVWSLSEEPKDEKGT